MHFMIGRYLWSIWRAADIKKRIFFFFQNSAFYHYSRDLTDLIS